MDIMGICSKSLDDVTIDNDVEGLSKHAFSAKFRCCQAAGGQTGLIGGPTVAGGPTDPNGQWRFNRPMVGGSTGHDIIVILELGQK